MHDVIPLNGNSRPPNKTAATTGPADRPRPTSAQSQRWLPSRESAIVAAYQQFKGQPVCRENKKTEAAWRKHTQIWVSTQPTALTLRITRLESAEEGSLFNLHKCSFYWHKEPFQRSSLAATRTFHPHRAAFFKCLAQEMLHIEMFVTAHEEYSCLEVAKRAVPGVRVKKTRPLQTHIPYLLVCKYTGTASNLVISIIY